MILQWRVASVRRRKLFLIVAVLICIYMLVTKTGVRIHNSKNEAIPKYSGCCRLLPRQISMESFTPISTTSHRKTIRILLWTQGNVPGWRLGTDAFEKCKQLKGYSCALRYNRHEYAHSDVILFHGHHIQPNDMPTFRLPHQKWLFIESEVPPQTWSKHFQMDGLQDAFNLTSTITMDSHIPMLSSHRVCHMDEAKMQKISPRNYASGKTRQVAWFVSHCRTQSKRELYAQELSKYIQVDVWGSCGNYTCGKRGNMSDCDHTVLDRDYKFYLSFENSICEGYVTEKLWRIYPKPISTIPIVLGGIDYKSHLPEKTYLDVKDFKSPKKLAAFLWELDRNDSLFSEYIMRKNAVRCIHPGDQSPSNLRPPCLICQYLHDHRHERSNVPNISEFWGEERRCVTAQDYFRGSFDIDLI